MSTDSLETAAKIDRIVSDVCAELDRATKKFGSFNSTHEGYAVIQEEVEELKNEVFWGPTDMPFGPVSWTRNDQRTKLMRAEAIQVAAMAIRFILDVCDGKAERR